MNDQVLGQMMIDTTEERVSGGIDRSGIVIYYLETIVADQIRAARQAKLKRLAERVLQRFWSTCSETVLRISVGRGVLNALERVACYRAKSREPLISKRKNIDRVEMGARTFSGPTSDLKSGSVS